MPKSQVENIHLYLIEDFLPIGMAIFNRAKKGGASKIIEGFTSTEHPVNQLREEGFTSARLFREKLDQIRPGLGNPVVEVNASVEPLEVNNTDVSDQKTLINILNRIDARIDAINNHFDKFTDC